MIFVRHREAVEQAFAVQTAYVPEQARDGRVYPFMTSLQWSRRFIGLKVFLSLAVAGWEGYEAAVRHQTAMGDRLRAGLREAGWTVVNDTPLPLVCFADASHASHASDTGRDRPAGWSEAVAQQVLASGEAWISTVALGEAGTVLRACITNVRTGPADVDALIATLGRARERAVAESGA